MNNLNEKSNPINTINIRQYDAFLLDIWGVIHDGDNLYKGVEEFLVKMKELGKPVILLSNAPRRKDVVMDFMFEKFGLQKDLYLTAVTSGEVFYETIKNIENMIYIGPKKDIPNDRCQVANLSGPDFGIGDQKYAIATGFIEDVQDIDSHRPVLKKLLENGVTMYCVNPDKVVVKINGTVLYCAGKVGEEYEAMGGKVIYFGKPYLSVYNYVFDFLSANGISGRILAVGDSLSTDIAGVRNAQTLLPQYPLLAEIKSCLIKDGIHKAEIEKMGLDEVFDEYEESPTYHLNGLSEISLEDE